MAGRGIRMSEKEALARGIIKAPVKPAPQRTPEPEPFHYDTAFWRAKRAELNGIERRLDLPPPAPPAAPAAPGLRQTRVPVAEPELGPGSPWPMRLIMLGLILFGLIWRWVMLAGAVVVNHWGLR